MKEKQFSTLCYHINTLLLVRPLLLSWLLSWSKHKAASQSLTRPNVVSEFVVETHLSMFFERFLASSKRNIE